MLATLLAGACTPPVRRLQTVDGPWRDVLASGVPAVVRALPEPEDELVLPAMATVLFVAEGARPIEPPFTAKQRAALVAFVAGGGRLLLLGHAAALAAAMGLESEQPEASTFRWGYDRRATLGRARLGVQVATGKSERRASLDKLIHELTVGGWR